MGKYIITNNIYRRLACKSWYNKIPDYFWKSTYLKIRFISNALRAQKPSYYLYSKNLKPFWRGLFALSIPNQAWLKEPYRSRYPSHPAQPPLQPVRYALSISLSNDARIRPYRNNVSFTPQWSIPISYRSAILSKPNGFKAFSFTHKSTGFARSISVARPPKKPIYPEAGFTQASHIRFGLNRINCLWQTSGSQNRLQPAQTRQAFLSSCHLFRGPYQRLLACYFSPRQYLSWERCFRSYKKLFSQTPIWYPFSSFTRRRWLLRPSTHRIPRREKYRLRHYSQTNPAFTTQALNNSFQKHKSTLASGQFFLPAYGLAKTAQIYCYAQTPARKPLRTGSVNIISTGRLGISYISNKFASAPRKHLAFLSRPRRYRTYNSPAQARLSFGKNTNQEFYRQRNPFSSLAPSLQSHQLVQKALSSGRIPINNFRHFAQPVAYSPGPVSLYRQSSDIETARELFIPRSIRICAKEHSANAYLKEQVYFNY